MCYKKFDEKGELNCGHCIHYTYEVGLEDNDEICALHEDMCEREDCGDWYPEMTPEEKDHEKKFLEDLSRQEARQQKRIDRLKEVVKPVLGKRFEALEEDFKEVNIHSMSITKVPPNKMYLEDKDLRLYIEQHGSEDYGGYHGRIWYHLKDKHWLVMEFNC
jgi:hypothetical protein